jgi:polyphosphate kinase
MSPMQIKNRVIAMINNEAKKGAEGFIIAKMNSLVDPDVIKALYYASTQGVKIKLIIRGICCLRPGVKGVSETIEVKSIVGKYLEHARIFYFKHSTPQMYISSADWMPRNLERRLELMTPIIEQPLMQKLYEILQLQLNDNQLSWKLDPDGEYTKIEVPKGAKPINNHQILEDYINKIYKSIKKDATSSKASRLSRKLFKES